MKSLDYKNYFLGLMSVKNAETLELRIISDDNVDAELLEAENDLIENYLDGKLANVELKAFNDNFLITNERRERVEFVRLMQSYAGKNTLEPETKPSFFEQLKAFVAFRPLTIALASLALILCVGIVWQIAFRSNVNVAEPELVAINKQDLSNLDDFKTLKNLSLASGSLRSGGNVNNLSEKDLTDKLLVRLYLPNPINSPHNFTVKILKDGQLKQTIVQKSNEKEVRLLIPKSLLTKGEYQITLEKDGEKYNYYFAVQE